VSCSSDRCLPSRLPCQVHADCPEFFYCNEFTAEEIPSHWPPGAGRACKPLVGHGTYAPRELEGGTLVDDANPSGGASAGGDSSTGGSSSTGGGSSTGGNSNTGGEINAGGSQNGGTNAGGATNSNGGSGTEAGKDANGEADSLDEATSSCACRTPAHRTAPGGLGILALVLTAALRLTRFGRRSRVAE
jgi:hypothetical protein